MVEITKVQIQATWGLYPARRITFNQLYQGLLNDNLIKIID